MKIIIVKPGVTDGSSVLALGTAIEFPETVAKSLIDGGYATAEKVEEAVDDTPKTRKTTAKKTK